MSLESINSLAYSISNELVCGYNSTAPLLLRPPIYVKTHLLLTAGIYCKRELVGIDCVTSNPNNGKTARR